jgi:hypothetical protein
MGSAAPSGAGPSRWAVRALRWRGHRCPPRPSPRSMVAPTPWPTSLRCARPATPSNTAVADQAAALHWIGAVEVVATALAAVRRTRKRRGFELRSVGNSRPLGPCLCAALTRPSRAALPLVVRRDSQTSVHAGSRTRRESMRGASQSALTRGGDRTGSVHGGDKSRARRDPPARRRGSEAKGPGEPKVGEQA